MFNVLSLILLKNPFVTKGYAGPEYFCDRIQETEDLVKMLTVFGRAIFEELKPLGKKVWEVFYHTIKSVQQQISFDINGNPVWGIGLGNYINPTTTLDEIFTYLASADKPCLVAIDEFRRLPIILTDRMSRQH